MLRRSIALLLTSLLAAAVAAPAAAAPAFPDQIDLPPGWQPEGITAGRGTTVFVGSLADGAIWKGDVRTGEGDTFVEGGAGMAVGVDYEAGADRLWVAGGMTGEVRVYDATTGELLEAYTFSPAGFLNDLVVTADGVYVTDSFNAWLNVIPLGAGGSLPDPADTFMLPLGGEYQQVDGFNANGIVASRGWLILVQSETGLLFRVDPSTGDAVAIDVRDAGGEPDPVTAGDGLELRGGWLYVVRNAFGLVAALRLGPGLTSATVVDELTSDAFDVPTTTAFVAGSLWVVNARFGIDPTDAPYWITRVSPNG